MPMARHGDRVRSFHACSACAIFLKSPHFTTPETPSLYINILPHMLYFYLLSLFLLFLLFYRAISEEVTLCTFTPTILQTCISRDILFHNHNIFIKFRKVNVNLIQSSTLQSTFKFWRCPRGILCNNPSHLPGSIPEFHIAFSCHISLLFLRSGRIFQAFFVLLDTDKFEEYKPVILQNVLQFGLAWYFLAIRFRLYIFH